MTWEDDAKFLRSRSQYDKAAALYEAAIEREPQVFSHYWHLGVLYLLQEKEEDARAAWLGALMEVPDAEMEARAAELKAILQAEARHQEEAGNLKMSWILRQHLREIAPEDANNLLSSLQLSLELDLFDASESEIPELIPLLAEEETQIDPKLLWYARQSLLDKAGDTEAAIAFEDACQNSPHFVVPLQLHIGGKHPHPDWKILDIEDRPEVDFIGDAAHLEQFEDNSVDAIYASHVLEHFYHRVNDELDCTLKEWHRVLKPGGQLMISVPDLQTVCWLYVQPGLSFNERLRLMYILYGGQSNEFDVHKVGFDFEILGMYLRQAGFEKLYRVKAFNFFDDCSRIRIRDTLISLNAIATKSAPTETPSEPS